MKNLIVSIKIGLIFFYYYYYKFNGDFDKTKKNQELIRQNRSSSIVNFLLISNYVKFASF